MVSPSGIGAVAEREVAYALDRAGWTVFLPLFAPHSRVDLMGTDPSGRGHRIQVKSARLIRDGTVITYRTCSNTGNDPHSYAGEVDAFGVWCPEIGRSFLVPIEDSPARRGHLRLTPPANRQSIGVRYATDHEILPVHDSS